jgi:MFS family permease
VTDPSGVLSRAYLPASIALYTTVALVAFQGLGVAAALPSIAGDLGGVSLLPWVITGFLVTSGVSTVVAGPLIDGLGPRTVFRWAVSTFTVAAAACSFAPSMPVLVAARVVQGIGSGLIFSVTLAAVGLTYPARLVSRAYAANSTVWGVMGFAGPGIAALLLTVLSWRWVFLVAVPLGALSLAAGRRAIPGPVESGKPVRLDVPGIGLVTLFNGGLLGAVSSLDARSAAWSGSAALAAALYWRRARRLTEPLIRPEHLIRHPFGALGLSVGLLLAGAIAVDTYLPLFVQAGRGGTAALTAWSVFFFTVGWTIGANVISRLTDRFAESTLILAGFAIEIPALTAVWAVVSAGAPLPLVFATLLVAGSGVGAATNAALTLLRALSPADALGRITAAHQFVRNQGFGLGAALGGAVVLAVVARRVGDVEPVRRLLAGEIGEVGVEVAASVRAGFAAAGLTGAAVAAAGILPLVALRRHLAPARERRRA